MFQKPEEMAPNVMALFNNFPGLSLTKPKPLPENASSQQMVPEFDPEKGLADFDQIPTIDEMEACLKNSEIISRKVSKSTEKSLKTVFCCVFVSLAPVAAYIYLASKTAFD